MSQHDFAPDESGRVDYCRQRVCYAHVTIAVQRTLPCPLSWDDAMRTAGSVATEIALDAAQLRVNDIRALIEQHDAGAMGQTDCLDAIRQRVRE